MTKGGNSQITLTITLLITIFSLSFPAYAKYSGGTGEPNDPYQIATADDLMLLGESPEDYDNHFILTADIDLDPNLPGRKVFDMAVIAPERRQSGGGGWEPALPVFTGVFDGNGHTISHLTIMHDPTIPFGALGLFGHTGSGARISNLGLEAVDVTGTGRPYNSGGLVARNDGLITSSYSTGSVTGGGLVGINGGTITMSYSTASVGCGGLVGVNEGLITSSHSTGPVTGGGYVGGLAGTNDGLITSSYSTGAVTGGKYVGGLVGVNHGSIAMSYSTGPVTGNEDVGGLVGRNGGRIILSYSTGTVTGSKEIGGLVGWNFGGSITNCYRTGAVTGNEWVGGLVGRGFGSITASFWDIQTSVQPASVGGTGLTTPEMQEINTYLSEGWDFTDEVLNGICDYWQISQGEYPRLRYQDSDIQMPEGLGTAEKPYLIRDARDLGTMWFKPMAHYRLETSLDLSETTWSMAVIPWFYGTFEGDGHVISNLHVQGSRFLGLFGQTGSVARISNLGLEAVDVNGTGDYVGSLVGDNQGSITMSYSTGTVSGDDYVGGLVGENHGSITMSYSTGAVSGDHYVGGLVGDNRYEEGIITASYSTGSVTGDGRVGGLVGDNDGSITTSFWDIQTSGQPASAGGNGLTTPEMQDINTYFNEGWDFVDEVLNGTCDYWQISQGEYPRLRYQDSDIQMPEGLGTAEKPYLIRDARELGTMWFKPMAYYRLEASLDLSETTWSMAVIPWFNGTFEGDGHVISNLNMQGSRFLGLFGQTGSGASISNLGLEAVDVNGTYYIGSLVGSNEGSITMSYSTGAVGGYYYVGGLVGENRGSITMSYSTGAVTGNARIGGLVALNVASITTSYSMAAVIGNDDCVGGLVAENRDGGSITMSYSTGTVSGDHFVGGLAGTNQGSIAVSYSTGSVSGYGCVGGLVGTNAWLITSSYSTGAVTGNEEVGGLVGRDDPRDYAIVSTCFWDTETSGLLNMCGSQVDGATGCDDSYGKTTAEMQTASTFLEAGWDFVDETDNGTDDFWWILEGQDYPRLWWELMPEN